MLHQQSCADRQQNDHCIEHAAHEQAVTSEEQEVLQDGGLIGTKPFARPATATANLTPVSDCQTLTMPFARQATATAIAILTPVADCQTLTMFAYMGPKIDGSSSLQMPIVMQMSQG